MNSSLVLGLDVGGTFTDVVSVDTGSGDVSVTKVLSTPDDLAAGVVEAISALPQAAAARLLVHGTTIATNALLERRTARAGLITTSGFRDVVEIRRRDRPHTYGLRGTFEPIIPRFLRLEVDERVNAAGEVEVPLDEEQLVGAAQELLEAGADSVAVAFLNSYANDENERAARAALERVWPNDFISLSTEIFPAFREFERWVTTSANAALQPIVGAYLERLRGGLAAIDFDGELLIMQSNGGAMSAQRAAQRAVDTVLSGPSGGVTAAARIGREAGYENVISCDMGGTSFDVCLIAGGRLSQGDGLDLEYGMPLQIPALDMESVGAGGGSIAWLDRSGILRIGPRSAGAQPGPAAYGRGGTEPTVTDAHVVLGRIGAGGHFGGTERLAIHPDLARAAIEERIAAPLGLGVEEAAAAVLRVADTHLAGAVRRVSLQRGHDPREFALVMFGGAGPLHVCSIMRELGAVTAIVPVFPGLTSALGCALADLRYDFVNTLNTRLDRTSAETLASVFAAQAARGRELLKLQAALISSVTVAHEADIAYRGQTHTVRVPLSAGELEPDAVAAAFERAYAARYGRSIPDVPAHVSNLRTTVVGRRAETRTRLAAAGAAGARSTRPVWFEGAVVETPVVQRASLAAGFAAQGPLLVEQPDTTTVVEPGARCRADEQLNVVIEAG